MLTVKRYPNRKLYDTEEKRYITLGDISERIRAGREIQVIDHASGEDITAVVLTQIILEQEKKQAGFVPRSVLTGLVQAGGLTISRMRRALANPLELLTQIDEEIEQRIEVLIKRGELAEDEARKLRKKLLTQEIPPSMNTEIDQKALERIIAEQGIPSRKDLQELSQQIEDLVTKLEEAESQFDSNG
jgi:polyhydroxyalkanoate synthesis repressor PhaR